MLSGDGSHRSSPRRSAAVSASPMAALISLRSAPADVAVKRAYELENEVVGAVERLAVDAPRHVVGAVVVRRGGGAVGEAGGRGGAQPRGAGRGRGSSEAASPPAGGGAGGG